MLLAIDIGNTNVTIGIFKIEGGRTVAKPLQVWRLATNKTQTEDDYGTKILDLFHYALVETADIKAVAIANVVPSLTYAFQELVKKYFKKDAFIVDDKTAASITIQYIDPREVGADRLANAAAAFEQYGGPAIVIDFGTATTFDCINKKGDYIGGVIAPGPRISAESLAKFTSRLPKVEMVRPKSIMGKTTIEGIQAGLYYGYVGLIKEILQRIAKEMKGKPVVIATGGLAGLIVQEISEVKDIAPELTLEGIRILWEKNHKQ